MADQGARGEPGENVIPLTGRRCPMCGRPPVARYRPFCSRRCADADLGRWLRGEYRIATDEDADQDGPGEDEV